MAEDKRRKAAETISEIDLRLDGLLGKLGESLSEMLERLDAGESGELRRSHAFESERGPLRAEAGVRVRFSGTGAETRSAERTSRPPKARMPAEPESAGDASASRTRSTRTAAEGGVAPRVPELESYVADGRWHLCADMPGASLPEIDVQVLGASQPVGARRLLLRSTGARLYMAEAELPPEADPSNMEIALHNGVLVIAMALIDAGEKHGHRMEAP